MSYHEHDDECPECGNAASCDEACINYVHSLTMSQAIERSRFSGNCYCLTTLREVNILDLEEYRESKQKPELTVSTVLNDRDRVRKIQKDRSHIYTRPKGLI